MKDLDFDELDRAVNSAINPQPTAPAEPEALAEPVAAAPAQVPEPAPQPAPVVETSSSPPVTPTPSPAARRSGGRFMDVVHPSSDMRAKNAATPAPPAPRPSEATIPSAPEPASSTEEDNETEHPLESPFIAGAKIEKRPLGSAPTEQFADLDLNTSPAVAEKPEESTGEETPAPEVSSEVLAVENQPVEIPSTEPTPAQEEPTGPTSILQQYKEQPTTEPQPSGAIYDTESYHQAITEPRKKLSALLVVLWILGLIVIGGGIGAVAYFYVLPVL